MTKNILNFSSNIWRENITKYFGYVYGFSNEQSINLMYNVTKRNYHRKIFFFKLFLLYKIKVCVGRLQMCKAKDDKVKINEMDDN